MNCYYHGFCLLTTRAEIFTTSAFLGMGVEGGEGDNYVRTDLSQQMTL